MTRLFSSLTASVAAITISALAIAGCGSGAAPAAQTETETTPASQNLGERIFVDTRFAQYFAANMTGVNQPLQKGDPVVEYVQTTNGPVPGPFAGQSINCRSCHFVTEFTGTAMGNRTYADFTTRSPIPLVMNGFDHTPRNAMQMVGSFTARSGPTLLHSDGEFADGADLVKQTLTGRNFGWEPEQFVQAEAHVAQIIRQDDGNNTPSQTYTSGLSYATMFLGTDPVIPSADVLEPQYRINVATATDDEVVNAVAAVVAAYAQGLQFKQDENGVYIGSPYDAFLRLNHLPYQPRAGQSNAAYAAELLQQVQALGSSAIFVTPADGSYKYHSQPYQFGQLEMQGLIIFLSQATNATDGSQHAGNCAACHQPPAFSDFSFHNTGASQDEYDAVHGAGSFMNLFIPTLAERKANYNAYLPVTANHPDASETFRRMADSNPNHADLGMWNMFLNPDKPNPQSALQQIVCAANTDCTSSAGQEAALASTIAEFKTPILRDLEDSAPYLHNGSRLKLEDVIGFYINSSALARQGKLRNAPAQFQQMSIDQDDIQALAAFLASLTEDYDDA